LDLAKQPASETVTQVYPRIADEIIKNNIFNATITGGEPIVVLKRAYPYLERLHESGVTLDLNSNLTMFTPRASEMLKAVGVRSILTSLMAANPRLNDSLSGREGTFEAVTRGIKLAQNEGFRVSVSMVITKGNLDQIFKTAEYAKSLGVKTFCVTKASVPINAGDFSMHSLSKKEFEAMLKELLRVKSELGLEIDTLVAPPLCFLGDEVLMDAFGHKSCSAGRATCTIGFDGSVRPCSQAEQSYGSVMSEGGLKEGWLNMQPWRTNIFTPDECEGCILVNACRGGCRAEAYAVHNRLNAPNPYSVFENTLSKKEGARKLEVNVNSTYIFNNRIKLRREDFGGIIYLSPSKWLAIDHILYDFAKPENRKNFTLSGLATVLGSTVEEVIKTANLMLQKGIIKEGGEEDGETI